MTRLRSSIILCLAAAAVLAPAGARSAPGATTLVGTVGENNTYSIGLSDAAGNPVNHLDPGTYTVVVHDYSKFHNFHLTGPGVNQSTGVAFVGDATWTVTLADGGYVYQCDVHRLQMYGEFTVGTPPAPPPAPKQLTATVGPRRTIALRDANGARVTSVTAGTYAIRVRDRTRKDNFRLRGLGVNRATGVRFRGSVRWSVTLQQGRYVYRSDRHKTLRGAFTVTAS